VWFVIVGLAAAGLAHVVPFPFLLDWMARDHVVWRMPAADVPAVYLTFDDGPNPEATPALLDALRENGAQATFFIIDAHLSQETAPILRRAFAEGHAVALHSDTRALLIKTPEALADTLLRQAERIEQLAGSRPCPLFRPHAGWRGGAMLAGLERIDYRLAGWTFGMWDFNWYRRPDPATLAARLARRASDGDIIVMHDGHHKHPRADRLHTVEATRQLVPLLLARGFTPKPLC
jgi:peptidoglycan-N-acetylglucosamine deacetylase